MRLNPFIPLHFSLTGRRNLILVPLALAAVIIFFASMTYSVVFENHAGRMSVAWLGIVTGAQALLLLLYGPGCIHRAVQRDFQSGMIESHRLAPLSGLRLVVGYLTGPLVQLAALYLVTLVAGSIFCGMYSRALALPGPLSGVGIVAGLWAMAQLGLLCLAFLLSSLTLLTALATRGKTNLVGWAIAVSVLGGWSGVTLVPGLALLCGIFSGGAVIVLFSRGAVPLDQSVVVVACAFQVALGLIFAAASIRIARAVDRPAFSIPLGLLLVGVISALLIVGTRAAGLFAFGPFDPAEGLVTAQFISSIVVLLLVNYLALNGAAGERLQLEISEAFGQPRRHGLRRAVLALPLILAAAAPLVMALLYRLGPQHASSVELIEAMNAGPVVAAVVTALVLSVWADGNLIYVLRAMQFRPWVAMLLIVVVLKVAPVAIDHVLLGAVQEFDRSYWTGYGVLSSTTPIGTLVLAVRGYTDFLWMGIGVQAAVGLAAGLLVRRVNAQIQQRSRRYTDERVVV